MGRASVDSADDTVGCSALAARLVFVMSVTSVSVPPPRVSGTCKCTCEGFADLPAVVCIVVSVTVVLCIGVTVIGAHIGPSARPVG